MKKNKWLVLSVLLNMGLLIVLVWVLLTPTKTFTIEAEMIQGIEIDRYSRHTMIPAQREIIPITGYVDKAEIAMLVEKILASELIPCKCAFLDEEAFINETGNVLRITFTKDVELSNKETTNTLLFTFDEEEALLYAGHAYTASNQTAYEALIRMIQQTTSE